MSVSSWTCCSFRIQVIYYPNFELTSVWCSNHTNNHLLSSSQPLFTCLSFWHHHFWDTFSTSSVSVLVCVTPHSFRCCSHCRCRKVPEGACPKDVLRWLQRWIMYKLGKSWWLQRWIMDLNWVNHGFSWCEEVIRMWRHCWIMKTNYTVSDRGNSSPPCTPEHTVWHTHTHTHKHSHIHTLTWLLAWCFTQQIRI